MSLADRRLCHTLTAEHGTDGRFGWQSAFEQKKYDETELDVHADFLRLGIEQQGQCKAFYKEICPYVIESVLTRDKDNKVEFIAERSQVSRGIIEVLYLLRCSLMHGEVFPDNNAMEVYKYAYSILAAILKKMF